MPSECASIGHSPGPADHLYNAGSEPLFLRRPSSLNLLQNGVWYRSTSANFGVLKVPLNLVIETGTFTEAVLRVPLFIKRWSHNPVCPSSNSKFITPYR